MRKRFGTERVISTRVDTTRDASVDGREKFGEVLVLREGMGAVEGRGTHPGVATRRQGADGVTESGGTILRQPRCQNETDGAKHGGGYIRPSAS